MRTILIEGTMQENYILRLEAELASAQAENSALRAEIQRLLKPPKVNVPGLDPEAWTAWEKYRRRLGKRPYKTNTVAARLAQHSPETQRAMVQQSIDHEWHGLFEVKSTARPGPPQKDEVYL
jgi:hypothetical protein